MKEVLNNIMHKNKILYGLSVCALLGMLCSCSSKVSEGGSKFDGTEKSQVAISGTETVADDSTDVVSKNETEVITDASTEITTENTNELLTEDTTDVVSEDVVSEESKTTEERREKAGSSELPDTEVDNDMQAESIYEELISSYLEHRKKYQNDGDLQAIQNDYKYEFSDLACGGYNIMLMGGDLSDVGYKIEDIDGDGISDLIIASKNSPFIYDLYTLVNETPKLLLSSWERCDVLYCGNYFYRDASGGAAYHGTERYVLKDGDMQLIDDIYTEPSEEDYEVTNYFYSKNPTYSTEDRETISEEQYEKYRDDWYSESCIVSDLTSFDDYLTVDAD